MKKLKVLVTGSTGQLGSELKYLATKHKEIDFHFKNRSQFDLNSKESIATNFKCDLAYDFVVNAGAFTAVDKAETDVRIAKSVNATALKHISEYAPKKTKIIHISSDYVYHVNPGRPLSESDKTNPQSVYAHTKRQGEAHLLKQRPDSIVLRTSWVYSSYGNNFVKSMIKLGKARDQLNIVNDQLGTPTYARDLAEVLILIMKRQELETYGDYPKAGIFNYSGLGMTSWDDFAREIFKQTKIKCQVGPISTAAYNAPAPRPLWSMMSKEKIQRTYHIKIPNWKKSLTSCLRELGY